MPANLTAPGVYIEEIPSGVRTIIGVSTSVTAFIGRARRGPMNRATRVTSFGEFDRTFGGLWNQSDLGHVVSHFFQNGGREAIIVRVHTGASASTGAVPGDMVLTATAAATALPDFHHLRVAVTHGGTANDYSLQITAVDAAGAALEDAGAVAYRVTIPLSLASNPTAAIAGAVTGTAPPIALAQLSSPPPAARPGVTTGVDGTGNTVRLPIPGALSFAAANPGTWGDHVHVTITPTGSTFTLQAQLIDVTGRELEGEIYYGLVPTPGALTYVGDVLESRSALLRLTAAPTAVPAVASSATLGGGSDGTPPDISAYEGSEADRTGLYALDEIDVVNLLCVPFPAEDATVIDEPDRAGFWSGKALPWCRARGAFAVIDPPPSWSTFDAVSQDLANAAGWMSNLQSPHGAQYFPNVRVADPLQENRLRTFPPSGVIAGVFARTDGTRGVWKAPAGLEATLAGVLDLSRGLTDGEQGTLNREGVNCLRAFAGAGRVAWGARTLVGQDRAASEWKYVPVRRLASYLQQTLLRGTRWAVFEGNDEPLWSQLRLNIGAFMHQLFRQGAFAGRTPSEAYFVRCNADTTTQADIDAGIVNVIIGFAPVKPAEFVVIKLQQIAGQST
ncbi:phage tail sheath family protein [Sorangium sp. KYC3313]|uniref:phage tail sheath family protein n=1 Tax=Sorangium sp. KYC3313 TaxID=3449740 RepID=UPI003F8902F0